MMKLQTEIANKVNQTKMTQTFKWNTLCKNPAVPSHPQLFNAASTIDSIFQAAKYFLKTINYSQLQ